MDNFLLQGVLGLIQIAKNEEIYNFQREKKVKKKQDRI